MNSRSILKQKSRWDELADVDPFWAVLSRPERQFGHWDLEEFFATGAAEVEEVLARGRDHGVPAGSERCLDFGCGPGRLTRALSGHFKESFGVDISEHMIARAVELHREWPQCHFRVNLHSDLSVFPERHFDLVYCDIVLQHIPSEAQILAYISEFIRVLRPGGLVFFQLLEHIPLAFRVQPRRRLYALLRSLRVPHHFLYRRLGLNPIRNNFVPELKVRSAIEAAGGHVVRVDANIVPVSGIRNCRYFATKYN